MHEVICLDMRRTYAYLCRHIRKTQHEALGSLFRHLSWLRNDTVAHYRSQYIEEGKIPTFFESTVAMVTIVHNPLREVRESQHRNRFHLFEHSHV